MKKLLIVAMMVLVAMPAFAGLITNGMFMRTNILEDGKQYVAPSLTVGGGVFGLNVPIYMGMKQSDKGMEASAIVGLNSFASISQLTLGAGIMGLATEKASDDFPMLFNYQACLLLSPSFVLQAGLIGSLPLEKLESMKDSDAAKKITWCMSPVLSLGNGTRLNMTNELQIKASDKLMVVLNGNWISVWQNVGVSYKVKDDDDAQVRVVLAGSTINVSYFANLESLKSK